MLVLQPTNFHFVPHLNLPLRAHRSSSKLAPSIDSLWVTAPSILWYWKQNWSKITRQVNFPLQLTTLAHLGTQKPATALQNVQHWMTNATRLCVQAYHLTVHTLKHW